MSELTDVDLAILERTARSGDIQESTAEGVRSLVAEVRRWRSLPRGEAPEPMQGEVTRDKFCDYEGWTLVVVSGDILVDGFRPDRARFQMRSPDGKEDVNLYVEDGEDDDGIMFFIRKVENHQRAGRP